MQLGTASVMHPSSRFHRDFTLSQELQPEMCVVAKRTEWLTAVLGQDEALTNMIAKITQGDSRQSCGGSGRTLRRESWNLPRIRRLEVAQLLAGAHLTLHDLLLRQRTQVQQMNKMKTLYNTLVQP